MIFLFSLLRSLLVVVCLSFITPWLLIGVGWLGLALVSYVPGLAPIGDAGTEQILQFLEIFGSGRPIEGIFAIALTCALVGALFEVFAFYRYQNLRGD